MSTRRLAAVLVAALLVAGPALAGCSGIPDGGDVRTNSVTADSPDDQVNIRVLAREPRPGASPTEIVAGFLTASASFDDDHAVAREYLTDAASEGWRPEAGVAVYDSDPGYQLVDFEPGTVRMLALRSAGSISGRGQFVQPKEGAQFRANFLVREVDSQWRIAGVPNGLILSTGDIARAYRTVDMFFLDIAGGVLVPDPLVLPSQRPGIATAITRQLLAGPTEWLAPAVRTAVPPGTRLAVDAVPVEDGVARVDLDRSALAATGSDRAALAAQLTYTLTQLADVRAVQITLNGVPFSVPGVGTVTTVSDWPTFNPDAEPVDQSTYAIDQGNVVAVSEASDPVPGFFGRAGNLRTAAVALDGRLLAAVAQRGAGNDVRLGPPGTANPPVAHTGELVTTVSFDRLNLAWIADRVGGRTEVLALRFGQPALRVRVDGLGKRSIEALRVSRDGARIALVVADTPGAAGELLLGRVQRGSGAPIVSGLRRVESSLSQVTDVAWADDTTLLVVARRAEESVQSFRVGIDGLSVTGAGSVPSLQTVAACPGRPNLAGAGAGTLWVDRGNGWRVFVPGTTPIYPG